MGKIVRVDEYNITYGKETDYLKVFAGFKYKKDGNKYVIYSHDSKNLFYGSLFIKDEKIIIMDVKSDISSVIKEFISLLLECKVSDDFEIISLDNVDSAEIIGENKLEIDSQSVLDLIDRTIPKKSEKVSIDTKKKSKKGSIIGICIFLVVILVLTFLIFNPSLFEGKKKKVVCTKNYIHTNLNAIVSENASLTFSGKDKIISIDITTDYKFTDSSLYEEFVKKNYFYQYMKDGDTYKLDNDNATYRVFSSIDTEVDYFLPTSYSDLISDYENKGYDCALVKVSDD